MLLAENFEGFRGSLGHRHKLLSPAVMVAKLLPPKEMGSVERSFKMEIGQKQTKKHNIKDVGIQKKIVHYSTSLF